MIFSLAAICEGGCSGQGTCVRPNECDCDDGWRGPKCSDGQNLNTTKSILMCVLYQILTNVWIPLLFVVIVLIPMVHSTALVLMATHFLMDSLPA